MRRVGVVLVAFALAAPAAGAATIHKYAGHAILPPPLPTKSALADLNDSSNTLVELDRVGAPMAAAVLRANGARLIAPQLDLWRVSSLRAQRILPSLMRLGLVRSVTPDTKLHTFAATNQYTDPLVQYEWWIPAIGADHFDPPGPGVPLTIRSLSSQVGIDPSAFCFDTIRSAIARHWFMTSSLRGQSGNWSQLSIQMPFQAMFVRS